MTSAEVDQVLDTADKILKVSPHPEGDTITVQNTKCQASRRLSLMLKLGRKW